MEHWRAFFASAPNNSSVFDVLDQAITIAASDFPEEFSQRKNRIVSSIEGASETRSGPVEPPKPQLIIRLKIGKPVAMDQDKLVEPTCVGEAKPVERKPCLDEKAIEAKLEATKRKFHDRYEEIEKNKRQKRIQVLKYVPEQQFKLGCAAKPQGKQLSLARRPKKLGAQSVLSRLVAWSSTLIHEGLAFLLLMMILMVNPTLPFGGKFCILGSCFEHSPSILLCISTS